uniref:Dentin sialophosphoprotein n=1 Tax=Rhizophora mucronata TaxID=61149 RepID=A0A2P2MS56_RHIMU
MATDAAHSSQLGISKNEALDQRVENEETTLGAFDAETQVVQKFELIDKLSDQVRDTDGSGGDVLQEPEKQKVDLLHDEVRAPGSEIAGATSSTIAKELTADADVVEEHVNSNEDLNPKAEAMVTDTIDGTSGDDGLEKRTVVDALGDNLARHDLQGLLTSSKRDSSSTKVDGIANATSESMEEKTQATAEGESQLMDNNEVTCPNIEDSKSSHQPTQIIAGGEAMATMTNMLPSSKKDQTLSIEKCLDQSITCNSAIIHSNVEPDIKIDTQITDIQIAGLFEQKVIVAEHQVMIDTTNDRTENHSSLSVNLSTSYQSAQSVGEIGPTNCQVSSNPNSDTDKTEPMCGGIELDVHSALSNDDGVVNSRNEVLEPAGKVLQSGLEECLEMSAACDFAQADSNVEQVKEVQDQVTPKQFEEEGKKIEVNSGHETASASTETNIEVVDGGANAMEGYERSLNSATEVQKLAEGNQHLIVEVGLNENAAQQISDTDLAGGQGMIVEEQVLDAEQFGSHEGQEMDVDEHDTDTEQPKSTEERSVKLSALKFGSAGNAIHASCHLFLEDDGEFSVSDLVWGKVRSHPWWPGQILDPSNASEKAIKYHKKDCFLVAYFGDRTFAWNEASLLKPFRSHFNQVEKQSTLESFQNAVNCALEEVARRVELGLACSCLPKDIYDRIRFQVVKNAGIREESTRIDALDKFTSGDVFEPDKLLEYMKELAVCPADGADRLELITAKSQLLAFCRFRGSTQLPEFLFCGDVLEREDGLEFQDEVTEHESPLCRNEGGNLPGQETLQTQRSSCHKRKHNLKDSFHARRKERSLTELTGEPWDSLDDEIGSDEKADMNLVSLPSGKKRKGSESFASDLTSPEGRKTISLAQVSTSISLPKPSFKIGECIRRVASQMTGSSSILKSNSQKVDRSCDGVVGDRFDASFQLSEDLEVKTMIVPTEYSSINEFLAQLHLAASDPLKRYGFLNIIISFFTDFRNSVIVDQHDKLGGKRKKAYTFGGSSATFEFEDMNDTYWTDRVIQNGSDMQPSRKYRKWENQVVPGDPDKSLRRSNSSKRYSDGYSDISAEKPTGYVDEKAPAELVMHFPVVDSVPPESNLNKMFRRFGPIRESETEVDRDTNRARVVFKRCSDAEAAYGSAPKFQIFGSMLVNYQLNYTISVPFKTVPFATTNGVEDATLFLEY